MLVYKNNFTEILPIFKESLNACDFLSFDCEMTGVQLDLKTDGTKFDTHEFRYIKNKKIVNFFDIIQIGITFYIKVDKSSDLLISEEDNDCMIKIEEKIDNKRYYLERTFTFYLFKNSKFKYLNELYPDDSKLAVFSSYLNCHPASLKFLCDNKFNFSLMVSSGIHYNKLNYRERIHEVLSNHVKEGWISNSTLYLSSNNEEKIVDTLKSITKFLIFGKEEEPEVELNKFKKNHPKPSNKITKISGLNVLTMNYLISTNLVKLTKIKGFNLLKDKSDNTLSTLVIEKSRQKLNTDDFMKEFGSFENFCKWLNFEKIFDAKNGEFLFEKEPDLIINEELGFSHIIDIIIQKNKICPVPIVGHNINYDLMFIYDKFIDDLPDSFFEYKSAIHSLFPIIYDNKFLTTRLAREFDNTKLDAMFRVLRKSKFDSYVDIKPDVINGFALYSDLENSTQSHDAGYDSLITGRCFIYLLKAYENHFKSKSPENLGIKEGFVDFFMRDNKLSELVNKTVLSLFEEPFNTINFDVYEENLEKYIHKEQLLISNLFSNVYIVCLKKQEMKFYSIYHFARLFENNFFNISVIKIDENFAFIEFIPDTHFDNQELQMSEVIAECSKKNEDSISYVVKYEEFAENFTKFIKN